MEPAELRALLLGEAETGIAAFGETGGDRLFQIDADFGHPFFGTRARDDRADALAQLDKMDRRFLDPRYRRGAIIGVEAFGLPFVDRRRSRIGDGVDLMRRIAEHARRFGIRDVAIIALAP